MSPAIVLCGPMGSGKSSSGRRLATLWDVAFRDTDADVEASQGRTIPEIFATDGEQYFRELEHLAVAAALREHDGVLALGGGAVLDPRTRVLLRDHVAAGGHVAFLDVSVRYAALRVGMDAGRPLLAGDPRERWAAIMTERRPVYEEVADIVVLTDQRSPSAVARALAEAAGRPVPSGEQSPSDQASRGHASRGHASSGQASSAASS